MNAHTTASWQTDDFEKARNLAFDPTVYEAICGAANDGPDDFFRSESYSIPTAGLHIVVAFESGTEALTAEKIKRIAEALGKSGEKYITKGTYYFAASFRSGEEKTLPARERENSLSDLIDGIRHHPKILHAQRIAARLDYLLEASREEDPEEQAPLSAASLEGFAIFLAKNRELRYPDIVLTYSGNVRAEWTGGKNQHFAIEFREDEDVRFVIFAPDPKHPYKTVQVSGTATVQSVMGQTGYYQVLSWAGLEGKRAA